MPPPLALNCVPTQPDIVIIGGGMAALCAAITARRAGASVLLLEQAPHWQRGGNTRHSRNFRIAHDAPTPFTTGVYSTAEFYADLWRATGGATDPALARLLVERSTHLTDWLIGAGGYCQPLASGVLPTSRKTAFLLGGGTALLNALYATAARIGVSICYRCAVRSLHITSGHITQIGCQQARQQRILTPRAVIACCGGGQANRDWLRQHWGPIAAGMINRGTPFATGDVLSALLAQGAQPCGDPHAAYLVAVDARSPADDGGIVTRIRCMPAGIVVDNDGQRRHDEGGDTASTRYALWGQRLTAYPAQLGHLILDADGWRSAPPSLYPPIGAPTIATLAVALQLPVAVLTDTVARYNAAVCATGADPAGWHTTGLAPAKSRHARPLITAPFVAYPMRPGITFTYYGVAVDTTTRIRHADGGVLANGFAAGMIMAPNLLGRGYISGLALTIGGVFGCMAGAEAAAYVNNSHAD